MCNKKIAPNSQSRAISLWIHNLLAIHDDKLKLLSASSDALEENAAALSHVVHNPVFLPTMRAENPLSFGFGFFHLNPPAKAAPAIATFSS